MHVIVVQSEEENQEHYFTLGAIIVNFQGQKWVAAAMIALASGSTVLLTSNTANAATSDTNSEAQVTVQNQNTTENKTSAEDTTNSHDAEQSNQDTKAQVNLSQQSNQEANTADQNNTPENDNQVQTPTNQADHVKGNV